MLCRKSRRTRSRGTRPHSSSLRWVAWGELWKRGYEPVVLRHDDVPMVVLLDVGATVAAHAVAQTAVGEQEPGAFDELVAVRIEEPGIAAPAMIHQHIGAGVTEDRRAHRHSLEGQQGQT